MIHIQTMISPEVCTNDCTLLAESGDCPGNNLNGICSQDFCSSCVPIRLSKELAEVLLIELTETFKESGLVIKNKPEVLMPKKTIPRDISS